LRNSWEWEEELLSLQQVYAYLTQGRWFRSIRSNGFFGLGRYRYYLGKCFVRRSVAVRFDPDAMALICLSEGSEETIRLAPQGLTKAELMGELAALQALPNYQLALPFSTIGLATTRVCSPPDRHDLVRLWGNG
jgi:hypothetical protein